MPQHETNDYELDLAGLPLDEVEEITRSVRLRELKFLGMTAEELEALDSRIDDVAGGHYTPMERAMIEGARRRARQKIKEIQARQEQAWARRWQVFGGEIEPTPRRGARGYWARWERFKAMAPLVPLPHAPHTVSGYCRWVHSLYGYGGGSQSAMDYGKFVERSVAKTAKLRTHSDWVELYHDPLDVKPTARCISALTLNGKPLWGAPDHVFQHKHTREVAIIERKASDREIPLDGWPDLRAQLWCYAQIDQWANEPIIRMVAEVWRSDPNGLTPRSNEGGVLRWMKGEVEFEIQNAALFALYKERMESAVAEAAPPAQ